MNIAASIDTMYLYEGRVVVNTLYLKTYEVSMTPGQSRAARAMLKLGVREVAELAKVTPNTVSRLEQDDVGPRGPQPVTVEAVKRVYEEKGILFIAENGGGAGVRLAKST